MNAMTHTGSVHVFERAGLGKAPYSYLGIEKESTSCQFCGTGIIFKFWLRSADGKRFFVGSDCIFKSGDAGLARLIDADVKKHQKELRDDRNKALIETFEAFMAANPGYWSRDTRPHPFRWLAAQGKTMGDYQRFIYEHGGASKKASLARQLLIAANVALPTSKRSKSAAAAPTSAAPSAKKGTAGKPAVR
jgi:hypothetical protein